MDLAKIPLKTKPKGVKIYAVDQRILDFVQNTPKHPHQTLKAIRLPPPKKAGNKTKKLIQAKCHVSLRPQIKIN